LLLVMSHLQFHHLSFSGSTLPAVRPCAYKDMAKHCTGADFSHTPINRGFMQAYMHEAVELKCLR
jgi:hypothetical protein